MVSDVIAEQTIRSNLEPLRRLISDLVEDSGIRDNLSAHVAVTQDLDFGAVRQMVGERVARVCSTTTNTSPTIVQVTEIATDLIWLLYWVGKFNNDYATEEPLFFIRHDFDDVDAVVRALSTLRDRFR